MELPNVGRFIKIWGFDALIDANGVHPCYPVE
jgi:hypothetical protein